mmetsp:Transcript_9694/g.29208  ORF Transcript_9694/g.29208 Transcript_9694/m.29208 type:complete len:82 (+) Transcript_9694:1370-1615(+)
MLSVPKDTNSTSCQHRSLGIFCSENSISYYNRKSTAPKKTNHCMAKPKFADETVGEPKSLTSVDHQSVQASTGATQKQSSV